MRKILLLLGMFPLFLSGQFRIDKFDYFELERKQYLVPLDSTTNQTIEDRKYSFRYSTDSYLYSNFLTNQFTKEALGGKISDETIDNVSAKLPEKNRFATIIDIGLDFQIQLKPSKSETCTMREFGFCQAINFGLRSNNFNSTLFQKDLTLVLLNGNAPYEDQLMEFNSSNIYNYRVQEAYVGYTKNISGWYLSAELGYLKGSYHRSFDIDRGSLFTSTYGTQVDLDIKYKDAQTVPIGSEAWRFAGHGANLNLYLMKNLSQKSSLKFQARNIGFVTWLDQEIYEGDTTADYSGVDIINDSGSSINNGDNVNEILGTGAYVANQTKWLPSLLHLEYQYNFSSKIDLAGGIKYFMVVDNLPQIYLRPSYHLFGKEMFLSVSPILSYGGFSRFDVGIGARFQYRNCAVFLDSFQLEQLFFAEKSQSSGLSVGLALSF